MGASSSSESGRHKESEDLRFESFLNSVCDKKPGGNIEKSSFVDAFPLEANRFAERLFQHISAGSDTAQRLNCRETFQRIVALTSSAQIKFYFNLYQVDNVSNKEDDIFELFKLAYYFHCHTSAIKFESSDKEERTLNDLTSQVSSEGEVCGWLDQHSPDLFSGLHSWLVGLITGRNQTVENFTSAVVGANSILNGVRWWLLSSTLPSLYSHTSEPSSTSTENSRQFWANLYSSNEHGLSVNRFQHHIFGYQGPTVLLVSCVDGHEYAVAVDTEWRDGTVLWGGQQCFLIQILPKYRIIEEGDQMLLFNEKSRNIPKGLFIGRDRTKYSLKVTDGLQSVEHDGKTVDILDIEVWGCGGTTARTSQVQQKNREKQDAAKNAKVKLPGNWEDNPDRLLLEWGGVRPSYGDQFKAELSPDAKS